MRQQRRKIKTERKQRLNEQTIESIQELKSRRLLTDKTQKAIHI